MLNFFVSVSSKLDDHVGFYCRSHVNVAWGHFLTLMQSHTEKEKLAGLNIDGKTWWLICILVMNAYHFEKVTEAL